MERALQRRLQLDDAVFHKFWTKYGKNIKIQGDILLVWADRPWHYKTKQEIYSLLRVCKQLDYCLPRLVIELIAYFIQQSEVFADYRNNTIEIITHWDGINFNTAYKASQKYCWAVQNYFGDRNQDGEINVWARFEKEYLPDETVEWMRKLVTNWDRYRAAHYWRNRLAKLCGIPTNRNRKSKKLAKSLSKSLWEVK